MLQRPDFCPFCGLTPRPDYVAREAEGGTICYCPGCENIVFVVPQGTVYEHMGRVYCLKPDSPRPPVSTSTFEKVREAGERGPRVDVANLFLGIVDGLMVAFMVAYSAVEPAATPYGPAAGLFMVIPGIADLVG